MPKRQYTLEELRLNSIEAERLLSPTDNTLSTVRTALQACLMSFCDFSGGLPISCDMHSMPALHGANQRDRLPRSPT